MDRKKDMVISGGINIFLAEIEILLNQHPAVLEAAVVGVPDERWGERLRAFVVVRHGSQVSPEELIEHCRHGIGGYKVPREIRFLDGLPRNPGGKVLKNSLRQLD